MKRSNLQWLVACSVIAGSMCLFSGSLLAQAQSKPELLVQLPASCPTPDGMAIASDQSLVVACPNYGDPSQPACLIKIDPERHVRKWYTFPPLASTGRACPMGIAFGPDGELYVCDNKDRISCARWWLSNQIG